MPSASCCFFHVFYIAENQYQMESKCHEPLHSFFWPEGTQWALDGPRGSPEGSTTHKGAPGGPSAPWWVVPTSGAPWTASLLYKYPNIPETLEDSTKYLSSRRESKTTRTNLDTITKGFTTYICVSPMMRE